MMSVVGTAPSDTAQGASQDVRGDGRRESPALPGSLRVAPDLAAFFVAQGALWKAARAAGRDYLEYPEWAKWAGLAVKHGLVTREFLVEPVPSKPMLVGNAIGPADWALLIRLRFQAVVRAKEGGISAGLHHEAWDDKCQRERDERVRREAEHAPVERSRTRRRERKDVDS